MFPVATLKWAMDWNAFTVFCTVFIRYDLHTWGYKVQFVSIEIDVYDIYWLQDGS